MKKLVKNKSAQKIYTKFGMFIKYKTIAFVVIGITIFISEIMIMWLFEHINFSFSTNIFLDSLLLLLINVPLIYFLLFHPLRKRIQQLKDTVTKLRLAETIIHYAKDGIVIAAVNPVDLTGPTIIYVNKAYEKMTGYTNEEMIGKNLGVLQGNKTNKTELNRIRESILKYEACEMEVINYKKNGEFFWTSVSITPIADEMGNFTHWIAIKRDITEQKNRDQDIEKAFITAQEKEREFIGSELHDNVLQILTGSVFALGMIKNLSERDQLYLNESKNYLLTSISEIRNLSHQLTPVLFKDHVLKDLFETLLKSVNTNNKIKKEFHFTDSSNKELKPDQRLNLYRILQEQLQNIIKYALATCIEVDVTIDEEKIFMRIYDNGKGFDLHATTGDGIGLSNIKKRTEMFNGHLTINSSTGNGCEMIVEIPIS